MAERELSFGEYLTQLREAKDVTLRETCSKNRCICTVPKRRSKKIDGHR